MQRKLHVVFLFITGLTGGYFYIATVQKNGFYVYAVVHSMDDRPFVFRLLLPVLARWGELLIGVDAMLFIGILLVLVSVGLYYSLRWMISLFHPGTKADIVAFVATELIFFMIFKYQHFYDVPTAMFFAIGFAALFTRKYWMFYVLFPIATLNRETTFLLTIFFFFHGFSNLPRVHWILGTVYQVLSFVILRLLITSYFAPIPGRLYWNTWNLILKTHTTQSLKTIIFVCLFAIVLWTVLANWSHKPVFLRTAFLSIFPLQFILYVTLGMPFEIRVFLEIFPVIVCLAVYPLHISDAFANRDHRVRWNYAYRRSQDEQDHI